jgi:hypothetical protein
MTPAAKWAAAGTELHCEHVVPINELRKRLRALWRAGPVTRDDVRCVLDADEIVVVTAGEVPRVNQHGVRKMPDGWKFGESHLLRLERGLHLKDADLIGERLIGHPGTPSATLRPGRWIQHSLAARPRTDCAYRA